MERFEVEYLKHSIFKSAERIKVVVGKDGLIELLCNGMVSVLTAERVIV